MENFEAFKESRLKMDPTSRNLSDLQWKQAFEAHLRARGRVGPGEEGSYRKRRGSSSKAQSSRGQHQPSAHSALSALRYVVRQQSAYHDLRLVVDILSWTGVVLVILAAVVSLMYYTSTTVAIVALLEALVKVIGIILVRILVHVIADIPDVALFRATQQAKHESDLEHATDS
jgi:hypothetical protein